MSESSRNSTGPSNPPESPQPSPEASEAARRKSDPARGASAPPPSTDSSKLSPASLEATRIRPDTSHGTPSSASPGASAGSPPGKRGPVRLGKFLLQKRLGSGGMGAVYQARDEQLNRTVALKTILPEARGDPGLRARLISEARSVAKLKHPGIISIHELGEIQGIPYLAMELIEGEDLAHHAARRVKPQRAVDIVIRVAEAVGFAHQHGVIHRDLKPANIMIRRNGAPVVMDFGLAKDMDKSGREASLTRTGDALGTPMYMPPEQVKGDKKAMGPATDVYALGAILYELIVGKPPFLAETVGTLFARILTEAPPRLRPGIYGLPSDLEIVVHRCMNKDPEKRYRDASLLARSLKEVMKGKAALEDDLLLPLDPPSPTASSGGQDSSPLPGVPAFAGLPGDTDAREGRDRRGHWSGRVKSILDWRLAVRGAAALLLLWGGWRLYSGVSGVLGGDWQSAFEARRFDEALARLESSRPSDFDLRKRQVQWETLRERNGETALKKCLRLDIREVWFFTNQGRTCFVLAEAVNEHSEPVDVRLSHFYLRAQDGIRLATAGHGVGFPEGLLAPGGRAAGGLAFPRLPRGMQPFDLIFNDGHWYQTELVGTEARMRAAGSGTFLGPEWLGTLSGGSASATPASPGTGAATPRDVPARGPIASSPSGHGTSPAPVRIVPPIVPDIRKEDSLLLKIPRDDGVHWPTVSPTGQSAVYGAVRSSSWGDNVRLISGDWMSEEVKEIGEPIYSADGTQFACTAKNWDGKEFVIWRGGRSRPCDDVRDPVLSEDGSVVAFVMRDGGLVSVAENGVPGPGYVDVRDVTVHRGRKHASFYACDSDRQTWFPVVGGVEERLEGFTPRGTQLVMGAGGQAYAYTILDPGGSRSTLMWQGRRSKPFRTIVGMTISEDGSTVAFACEDDGKNMIEVGGRKAADLPSGSLLGVQIALSGDGRTLCHGWESGPLVWGGEKIDDPPPSLSRVSRFFLSADGSVLLYPSTSGWVLRSRTTTLRRVGIYSDDKGPRFAFSPVDRKVAWIQLVRDASFGGRGDRWVMACADMSHTGASVLSSDLFPPQTGVKDVNFLTPPHFDRPGKVVGVGLAIRLEEGGLELRWRTVEVQTLLERPGASTAAPSGSPAAAEDDSKSPPPAPPPPVSPPERPPAAGGEDKAKAPGGSSPPPSEESPEEDGEPVEVLMRDGRVLKGRLVSETDDHIIVNIGTGGRKMNVKLSRKDIQAIAKGGDE
ncbi:MAG: serine/threonine protein kinase [Planctomycetes bacterium]|nr:serine/threonine protein kinase [Planctomycetota bacterium]